MKISENKEEANLTIRFSEFSSPCNNNKYKKTPLLHDHQLHRKLFHKNNSLFCSACSITHIPAWYALHCNSEILQLQDCFSLSRIPLKTG